MRRRSSTLVAGMVAMVVLILLAGCSVFDSPPPPRPTTVSFGTVDDGSSDIVRTGPWKQENSPSSADGHLIVTDASEAAAELGFVGASIAWIGPTSAASGIADVFIDGEKRATVSAFGADEAGTTLFSETGLTNAEHTIRIVVTGTSDPAATGAAIAVDSFVVGAPAASTVEDSSSWSEYAGEWTQLDSRGSSGGGIHYSDDPDASVSLQFEGGDVAWYTWKSESGGAQQIFIDGAQAATFETKVEGGAQTRVLGFSAHGLGAGVHTIRVTSSGVGTLHHDAFVVGRTESSPAETTDQLRARMTEVPETTQLVGTEAELSAALGDARPGTVIELKAGVTFTGAFRLTASGTSDAPIWVTGPRSAVLQTGDLAVGAALRVSGAHHVRLNGFTVTNSRQGVMVNTSSDVSVADLHVHRTGYEAVHFYNFTTDSFAVGNLIEDTGLDTIALGEGVYIGTSDERWGEATNGKPDASDRNVVAGNTIRRAGAESIEAKQGTSGGVIRDNVLDAHGPKSTARSMILVGGSGWTVEANTMSNPRENFLGVTEGSGAPATGNVLRRNVGHASADDVAYGFRLVTQPGSDLQVEVACDNVLTGGADFTFANVFCSP